MNNQVDRLIAEAEKCCGGVELENGLSACTVSAALLSRRGNIFTGVCLNLACGIGFCAEHSAIAELLKNRETEIEMIVAVSVTDILSPCGRCRELMAQIDSRNLETKIILPGKKVVTLRQLLPDHWLYN